MLKKISGKRILCTAACTNGHYIPVLIIAKMLSRRNKVYYLDPSNSLQLNDDCGIELIQNEDATRYVVTNNEDFITESIRKNVKIIEKFSPDITIQDFSFHFQIAAQFLKTPCTISVLRADQIPGYERLHYHLPNMFFSKDVKYHSILNNALKKNGMNEVSDDRTLKCGDLNFIPSIPDLDPLPEFIPEVSKDSFFYLGPLYFEETTAKKDEVVDFIKKYRNKKKIITVTLGTEWHDYNLYERILEICSSINDKFFIFIIPDASVRNLVDSKKMKNLHICGYVENLDTIIRHSDLIIHQCGHGISLMCLANGKPFITIPSCHFDRDDNALRLEMMGVSRRFAAGADTFDLPRLMDSVLSNAEMNKKAEYYKKEILWYKENHGTDMVEHQLAEYFAKLR